MKIKIKPKVNALTAIGKVFQRYAEPVLVTTPISIKIGIIRDIGDYMVYMGRPQIEGLSGTTNSP